MFLPNQKRILASSKQSHMKFSIKFTANYPSAHSQTHHWTMPAGVPYQILLHSYLYQPWRQEKKRAANFKWLKFTHFSYTRPQYSGSYALNKMQLVAFWKRLILFGKPFTVTAN